MRSPPYYVVIQSFTPPHTKKQALGGSLKVNYVTLLRGIAIILVLISHFTGNMSVLFTPLGGIGVAIFLILSGYGLNESYRHNGLHKFWHKRFTRLWIPYAIILSAYCILDHNTIQWFLYNLTLVECPYWFIQYIAFWYVAFWLINKYCPKHKISLLYITGAISLFLTTGVRGEQALSFATGVLISEKRLKLDFNAKKIPMKYLLSFAMIGIIFLGFKQTDIYRTQSDETLINLIQLPVKLLIGIFIIFILAYIPGLRNNRFLLLSGLISYELYMVHYPFRGIAGNDLPIAVAIILASYIVSYIIYKIDVRCTQLVLDKKIT